MSTTPTVSPSHVPPARSALRYELQNVDGRHLLAADPPGGARIVEALGEVATADHVAVLVPGAGHDQRSYLGDDGPESLRGRGERLLRSMEGLTSSSAVAVVVWVGYHTPSDLAAATSNLPAHEGAPDLARLTHYLPRTAHITLIGHSYGSTVSGLALSTACAADCVALGSPGMGVWRREELGCDTRLWAAQGPSDWIRFVPRTKLGTLGLGRTPLHPALGARRFATGDIAGHSGYFTPRSESLHNIARIAVGLHDEVTPIRAAAASRPRARHAEVLTA